MSHIITENCTGCTACVHICPVSAILGQRGQLHAIDPARCIDCGACGLICPVDAILDQNEHRIRHVRRSSWPKPVVIIQQCVSCMACLQACPVNCLGLGLPDPHSHRRFPVLKDSNLCITCQFCARDCPVEAIIMERTPRTGMEAAPSSISSHPNE